MNVTVMSFNTQHCMNYITREIDFDVMADAIRTCGADIIGLNEMYGEGTEEFFEPQVQILAEKLGYYYYFAKAIDVFSAPSPYGNGLLSRFPIKNAVTIPVPDPDPATRKGSCYETRCLLKAELELGEGLTVCVCHFGLNADEQENAASTVVANLETSRCVLMGDFNVLPEDPVLSPIRAKMTDASDVIIGSKLSFPSDKPDRKIDYVFVSRDIKVISAEIPAIVASDHRPHTADIEF